jgi:peptidoglycan hydrolase-like protein with peptidoglycan-binding domain
MKNKILWSIAPLMLALAFFVGPLDNAFAFTHLNTQLNFGARGTEVTNLQTFLASNYNVYPQALVTGYYGSLTRDAVSQFQIGYGLSPVGRVGSQTLIALNSLIDSGKNIDVSAPYISGAKSVVSGRTAYISWNTNENTRSKLFYDNKAISMLESTQAKTEPTISGAMMVDSVFGTAKSLTLQNLQPVTVYYYVIESIDDAGNVSVTMPQTFITGQ